MPPKKQVEEVEATEFVVQGSNVFRRVLEAAKAVGVVPATGRNPNFNYAFVEEGHLVAAVRDALYNHGVLLTSSIKDVNYKQYEIVNAAGKVRTEFRALLNIEFTFINVDTPTDFYMVQWTGEAADAGDKTVNKAVVSALKYMLLKNLLIPKFGDDAEADNTTDDRQTEKPAAPTKPAPKHVDVSPAAAPAKVSSVNRDRVYTLLREYKQASDGPTLRGYANGIFNREVRSLFHLNDEEWGLLGDWIVEQFGSPVQADVGDDELPF